MKTQLTKETRVCDVCKEAETYEGNACLKCGKDYCWKCQAAYAVEYRHAVNLQGSGDGTYCIPCDQQLRAADVKDPIHAAYRRISDLRKEADEWYANFRRRSEEAEKNLKELQGRAY